MEGLSIMVDDTRNRCRNFYQMSP